MSKVDMTLVQVHMEMFDQLYNINIDSLLIIIQAY